MNRELGRWYRAHGRHDLPWRLTRDPYAVLVSEVMLQQTQVDRVVPYFARWLGRWPTVESLAAASPADVIREWAGLGYNRRALNLHQAAMAVVDRHAGRFPRDPRALRVLPGVGPYTAAAIASFAFGQPVALVDTNVARVLARARLGVASHRAVPGSALHRAAEDTLPARNTRDHNLALMDLGAVTCTARNPQCASCPLCRHCAWCAAGSPPSDMLTSPAARFETTARFARGRIIAALRDRSPLDEPALASRLPDNHRPQLPAYLAGLARDGLITPTPTGWSLPGTANRES